MSDFYECSQCGSTHRNDVLICPHETCQDEIEALEGRVAKVEGWLDGVVTALQHEDTAVGMNGYANAGHLVEGVVAERDRQAGESGAEPVQP